ncbi:MAG: arsenate reductase ArsC [Gemmatimonadota bacterium]|jgi:arsenate reductase|nr:arsenate reductase ArsC [Gemmatimonadota bacterium]MDQ8152193.1 arsenate reductase ArsC [Gemmatimonadota bacterium]MDQ8170279.1 arsenate reductase ArsC [Gemmatimonadota bacterium]MDQ8174682.1 arsenate reductase ArsC [Gemmatimonadota bacterium]MDQ8178916.1 arsenate reductase ArsC [Gemmatimonadota bacterium]
MTAFQILVLCTGNSARSQVAEALIATLGAQRTAGRVTAASAGSHPAARVNPGAIAVLASHGITWGDRIPKQIDAISDQPFDLVITVCDNARDACPILPGARATVHWGLPDPADASEPEQLRTAFAATYEALHARIEALLALPLETLSPSELSARAAQIHRSHPLPTFG